jgi:hypothetical protein
MKAIPELEAAGAKPAFDPEQIGAKIYRRPEVANRKVKRSS